MAEHYRKGKMAFFIVAPFLAASLFFLVPKTHAQTAASPQFLVTWKTSGSYVPPSYPDKALPTYGSEVTASLQLFSQGQLQNLQNQTIYWYLNDGLIGGGVGVQQISFPPLGEAPSVFTLKVELPSYNGNFLIHEVPIPMAGPTAVVYAPYPNGQTSANPIMVRALPYFFNTSDPSKLSYSWQVNGQAGSNTEDPQDLEITLPAGTTSGTGIAVSLSVENAEDSTAASADANLIYVTQL